MAGIKIVDLPALGRDLISTDLLEVSLNGSGSRKITGQEIMNASKLAVGSTPIVSGTVGRLLFQNTGDVLGQSANLFWDATNNRLGIGTSTPTNALTLGATVAASLQSSAATIFTSNENASNVFSQAAASNTDLHRPVFAGIRSRGTLLSPTAVQSGDAITTFLSSAFDGTAGQASAALSFDAESNASSGNAPQLISFITGTSGASRTTKMQVRSNGNVLINTTTDAGFRLDVNGTARVVGPTFAVGDWTNRSTSVYVRALTGGSENRGFFIGTGASNDGNVGSFTYQPTGNLLNIRSPYNSGTVALSFEGNTNSTQFHNTSGIVHSKIVSGTGNWLINTTTDDGYKLDVNGIARVNGLVTATLSNYNSTHSGNTTRGFYIVNSADSIVRAGIEYDGTNAFVQLAGRYGNGAAFFRQNGGNGDISFLRNGVEYGRIFGATGNWGINTTTDAGFRLDVNGTARVATTSGSTPLIVGMSGPVGISIEANANGYRLRLASSTTVASINTPDSYLSINSGGQLVVIGSTSTYNSAQVAVDSTTKGFLPPRMTNAQRAAIASPAVGLIVYCTDSTEGLYVYKSTGWTFMV